MQACMLLFAGFARFTHTFHLKGWQRRLFVHLNGIILCHVNILDKQRKVCAPSEQKHQYLNSILHHINYRNLHIV